MSWISWLIISLGIALIVFLLVRFLRTWFCLGGNDASDYYSDSEK